METELVNAGLTGHQIDAMSAIFKLCEAINEGKLSIAGLEETAQLAVSDGHDNIVICLSMASLAVSRAKASV